MEKIQVVIALHGGDKFAREIVTKEFLKQTNNKMSAISLVEPIKTLVGDPSIFNVPPNLLQPENLNTNFPMGFIVKETHIKRLLRRMHDMTVNKDLFNPYKIGVNHFRCMKIANVNDLLKYIGYEVIRFVDKDFLPNLVYNRYVGKAGNFIIDGIKFANELDIARQKFQFVYPIRIVTELEKKADERFIHVENDFESVKFFRKMKIYGSLNQEDLDSIKASVGKLIKIVEEDVNTIVEKHEKGEECGFKSLPNQEPVELSEEGLKGKKVKVGKFVLEQGKAE